MMDRHCDAGSEGNTHAHLQRWHLYLLRHNEPLPERFDRAVVGNTEEECLAFSFKWPPIDTPIKGSTKVLRRRMSA